MEHSTAVAKASIDAGMMERVLLGGDLSALSPEQRLSYYKAVCESVGLNPLTKPFDYLQLDKKLVLYAKKDCTDQLRSIHGVSVKITAREVIDSICVVTASAVKPDGRTDESIGAVPLVKENGKWETYTFNRDGKQQTGRKFVGDGTYSPLSPEEKANCFMKSETKAKRRVTLSVCGLGIMDESELDTVHGAKPLGFDPNQALPAPQQQLGPSHTFRDHNPEIDPELQALLDRAATHKGRMDVLAGLKQQLHDLSKSDDDYFTILKEEFGIVEAKQLRMMPPEEGAKLVKVLYSTVKADAAFRAAKAPDVGQVPDDAPLDEEAP